MVKHKSNDKKSVKEVIVKKPKEAPVTSAQPLEPEKKPETKPEEIKIDLGKLKDDIVNELKPVEVPKKTRKKRETKPVEPIAIQPIPKKEGRGTSFYVGLGFGIVIATLGVYFVYMKFKEWSKDPQRKEDNFVKQLEQEGVKSIENIRKEN